MSQTLVQTPDTSTIPPAFRKSPVNPYGERARAMQEQIEAELAAQRQAVPQTAMVPPTVQESGSPAQQPAVETNQAQPVHPSPAPSPQPATPQPPVQQPKVDYTPPQYNNDPSLMARLQQMEQERAYLAQEIETRNQTINNLMQSQQELDQIKAQNQLYSGLNAEAFNDLSTVDAGDAQRISAATLDATSKALAPIREELAQQRKLIDERMQQQQQQMEAARIRALNAKVLAAHPDYYQLVNSQQYKTFMSQRDGLSSKTRDVRAAEEFLAGNTDYVIDMLNRLKGITPPVEQVQAVAPVQVATNAGAAPVAPASNPQYTLEDLNRMFGQRLIDHDQYRMMLKELRSRKE